MRGLVDLGPYVFYPWAERRELIGPYIEWWYRDPDNHTPGQSRMMTGWCSQMRGGGWRPNKEAGVVIDQAEFLKLVKEAIETNFALAEAFMNTTDPEKLKELRRQLQEQQTRYNEFRAMWESRRTP
jgi:hypothetical protein